MGQALGATSRVERAGAWVCSTWRAWLGLRAWLWPRCIAGELASSVGQTAIAIQGWADLAVEEGLVERGGAGPGGLGDQARLVQRHGPGVAVRGMCEYTIRG